jgi:16S rRNA (uracil1498-N3)-methyltransferase
MTFPRIFVPTKLNVKQKVALDAAASRHVLQVLRLQPQAQLTVFNATDGEFQAHIAAIAKRQAIVFLEKPIIRNDGSSLIIHLGQGISRGEKMDFTIQKTVELGITTIIPLFTTYCNVKLDDYRLEKKLLHWQGIAVNAAEQSGRCYVPKILPSQPLAKWLNMPDILKENELSGLTKCGTLTPKSWLRLVFDPNATNKLSSLKEKPDKVTILVGPEGGLSEEEIALAEQQHFLPITLGPRILRTETAALAAISILQAKWGDM